MSDRGTGAGPVEPPSAPGPAELGGVLAEARARGLIGGGDVSVHVRHAHSFASVIEAAPATVLDLGSGGGLPGLVLACRWPGTRVTLLDGSTERCAFLRWAVAELDLDDRAGVVEGRAEAVARGPLRAGFEVVVARAFGPPAVVAECGAPFLATGGRLVVSEPPGSDGRRWDHPDALAGLGLRAGGVVAGGEHRFEVLRSVGPCPDRFPRRVGIPAKRPLF